MSLSLSPAEIVFICLFVMCLSFPESKFFLKISISNGNDNRIEKNDKFFLLESESFYLVSYYLYYYVLAYSPLSINGRILHSHVSVIAHIHGIVLLYIIY